MARPARDLEDSTVRKRPLLLLSTVAAATLFLAGCSGSAEPDPTASSESAGAADLCAVAAEPGAVTDAVKIDGSFGEVSTAEFEVGQTVDELQRTVVSEGDGDKIADGAYRSEERRVGTDGRSRWSPYHYKTTPNH